MLGTSARPILTSGPALFTPKLPKVAPHSAESGRGRGLESTRRRCTERWELVWLAGACAVGMRRSGLSRTLAIAACRAAQQGSRRPGVELRMKKMNRALRRALRAPGPGRNVGSCPAAKFARGPEIRAMRGACGHRGEGRARGRLGSPGGRAHMLALGRRTLQVPKRRRAHTLDVLSTAYQHPGLPPVAQSCARGMGGMNMRRSRRCLVRLRRATPTHCVDLCIKVRSQRPPTGRRSAVLPLIGAVARGGPGVRRRQLISLAPSLVLVQTMRSHR